MAAITSGIIEEYFETKQHDAFLERNNTDGEIYTLKKEFMDDIEAGENISEEINGTLKSAFNLGEYYGIMQGIGIGLQILHECL